tara:strand:+ start:1074 stop:1622 length:549 start_codon:yes stop_codon:yes gene_type:complete
MDQAMATPAQPGLNFRPFEETDLPYVERIFREAFAPSRFEADLSRGILGQGREVDAHAWLARIGSLPIAAILFTPAKQAGQHVGYHLAPVAVQAEFQGKGIGSALVSHTLAQSPIGEQAVFVLGDPSFYERFGFEPVQQARCPFDPGNRHFRALRWFDDGVPFDIAYAPAFWEVPSDDCGNR